MITAVMGTTQSLRSGSTVLRPSTEDSTEIAGVIMLSPKNSAAPKRPSNASISAVRRLRATFQRRNMVMSAMMPPSPSLSARITSVMYVKVTMIMTDQKISDTTPYTLSVVMGTGCGSPGLNTVWMV